jgi:hypothetical protein
LHLRDDRPEGRPDQGVARAATHPKVSSNTYRKTNSMTYEPGFGRVTFDYESTARRMHQTVDLAAVLRDLSAGELAFLAERAGAFSALKHRGIARFGGALGTLVDAERARREWEHATMIATFDVIVTEQLRPPPSDADLTGLPPWSEAST